MKAVMMRKVLGPAIALVTFCSAAVAGELMNAEPGGLAVKGYDVVAYFTAGAPTPGNPDIEHVWRDVRWRFSSVDNRAAFAAEPNRYAPRYGGFCAGGIALGQTSQIDPEAFVIVDGKLYLNFDKATATELKENPDKIIESADLEWKKLNAQN
jgi:hypothetical protein